VKIQSLHIYPLKSGRVIDLAEAEVTAWGLAGDRRFMLVDPDGKFITQRKLQSLAQVTASSHDGVLTLSKLGEAQSILASFDLARRIDVDLWGSKVTAAVALDGVNHALSAWFGIPVLLVHADAETHHQCSPDWAGSGVSTGFSDGYPVLITTIGSLEALNAATRQAGGDVVGMERFRPNIVLDDTAAFADDHWASLEIGGLRFDLVKPCARCIMTTQDQLTGDRGGPDPMPAMRQLRLSADRRVPGVLFGWNAVARSTGRLVVGDTVAVTAHRPEGWPLRQR